MNPYKIFEDPERFDENLKEIFAYQYENTKVYRRFCDALGVGPEDVRKGTPPPVLPVEAFRESEVLSVPVKDEMLRFKSSGTTGMKRSVHYVPDPELYRESVFRGMSAHYILEDFVILAYTPGYVENKESSLIRMLHMLIEADDTRLSRFLDLDEPVSQMALDAITSSGKRVMLFGAAFGLLDLADRFPVSLPEGTVIIETGGMKTYRREITRTEMHQRLADAFKTENRNIHSEYGMTELLSQAWADGSGRYTTPHWMEVTIRNPQNPLLVLPHGEEGLVAVTDLANFYSCSFLLTGDKGVRRADGSFSVLGRHIPENLRGCNFLIDDE